ncbi:glycosyltransferase family 4 protein [Nitrosococcus halophilus]|uniref:glycosyltransferase family 4 protein n=1 Tax=Nitrosococcus halophilus TaxID=133539 RepID=UPI0012FF5A30|nr:glycosyltransferase family 4 protein [Nitrosococcus halophilus]
MKVWLPYTQGGGGSDVFTHILAKGLRKRGIDAVEQPFAHHLQYVPWLLRKAVPPPGTDLTLTNTWNGLAFKRPGIKLVTVEHLFVLDPALRPYRSFAQGVFHQSLVRYFEHSSHRASEVQVAVSQYAANAHHRILGNPKPRVILNGIDTHFFTPPKEKNAPAASRPFRLLFVGNLTRRKGVDLLPPIMDALGEGFELEYAAGLRTTRTLAGLKNARNLGSLDHEQVRQAYRRADVLLFPTRLEGFGYAAAEAMACGTPVVATRVSSLPEVVQDGLTGVLCPVDDVGAFVSAIRTLARDKQRRMDMGRAARAWTVEHFDLDGMIGEYVRLCESLVRANAT